MTTITTGSVYKAKDGVIAEIFLVNEDNDMVGILFLDGNTTIPTLNIKLSDFVAKCTAGEYTLTNIEPTGLGVWIRERIAAPNAAIDVVKQDGQIFVSMIEEVVYLRKVNQKLTACLGEVRRSLKNGFIDTALMYIHNTETVISTIPRN